MNTNLTGNGNSPLNRTNNINPPDVYARIIDLSPFAIPGNGNTIYQANQIQNLGIHLLPILIKNYKAYHQIYYQ